MQKRIKEQYKYGDITWDVFYDTEEVRDGVDDVVFFEDPFEQEFVEGNHKVYGKAYWKTLKDINGDPYSRIFFENHPHPSIQSHGIDLDNIRGYFRIVD